MTEKRIEVGMEVAVSLHGVPITGVVVRLVAGEAAQVFFDSLGSVVTIPFESVEPKGWRSTYVSQMQDLLDKRSAALVEADRQVLSLTRAVERLQRAVGAKFAAPLSLERLEEELGETKQKLAAAEARLMSIPTVQVDRG